MVEIKTDISYFTLPSKERVERAFDSAHQILLLTMANPLFYKLMESAKAIKGGNLDVAESNLKEIRSLISTEVNTATRKVVKCYAEALVRRVNGLHPRYPLPLVPSSKLDDFYNYVFYPFYWFSYFTTKHAILDAFSRTDDKPLHVIDFSVMLYISLWHDLMQDLANRPGGLPSFRLTSIMPKLSKNFDYFDRMRSQLTGGANSFQIDFELRQVVANNANDIVEYCLSTLRRTREDEMLVVRWSFSLHKLLSQEGAIEQVLSKMKDLKPDIMIIVEQEGNHNGPDFLDRFVQSFQYYSTIFHSLEEDNFSRDVDCIELWKRNFRRQIGNVVGCEGIDRVERHESLYQWQNRLSHARFHPVHKWWKEDRLHFSPKYRIEEKDGHPVLYRDNYPLLVTSVWKHSDPTPFRNGSITLQDVTMFPLAEKSELATSSESEDEQADDREGNMWFPKGFSKNHIAASANLFDILEHVCHVHKFPLALTWVCHVGKGNANSKEKRILHIEEMACYVNSCWENRFVGGYAECYIKEGQGIAGKALQSNLYFVPDISLLDVVDYPFVDHAHKHFLNATVAIKLTSTYNTSNDYVVEFFLPPQLKESSEQHMSINGLLCTLRKKCGNLWKIWCMDMNGPSGSEGMFGGVGVSSIPPAAVSRCSPLVLSDGVSSLNEMKALDMSNPTSDEVETLEPLEQENTEQNAMVGPAVNSESELASNGSANREMVIRKRRKVSSVWEGFNKHEGKCGEVWATCKYCNKQYRAESTRGTSNLHTHLKKCVSKRQEGAELQSSPLVETGVLKNGNFVFDQERSRLDIARMVIKHGYPLAMVQHELFEIFVKNLQPMFKLHSQDIVEEDVLVIYRQEKEKLIKYFDSLSCLFCLTIELLSSDDKKMTYCCLVLHFIDDGWQQKKKILAFKNLSSNYDAETVHEIIKSVLIEWGISKNLCFVWLNIAPPNDQMIGELKSKLSDQISLLNRDVCYLSSYAQVVHLLIQDGFFEIKSVLCKIRESIEYVNGTQQRRQMFLEVINQLKLQDQKMASLDVPTGWDTTFLMLEKALKLRNAFAHLEQTDGDFKANPYVEEWNMATIIFECLKVLLLHESECNASTGIELYFLNVCGVFKNLIQWKKSQHIHVRSMADRMMVKFDKDWNKCCLALGILTILNPCFKLDFVEYSYNQIYGSDAYSHLSRFLNDLRSVYYRYANNMTSSTSTVADVNCCASFDPNSDDMLHGFSMWQKHKRECSSVKSWKVELDQYLEQPPEKLSKDYNVLDWWHANAPKFPVLRRMARDFLSTPISAIVSNSSVAEKVVKMNSNFYGVCPEIVEALVCGKDWLEGPERKINQD